MDDVERVARAICPHRKRPLSGKVDDMPVRIQRKRTKGWRMPENTVYVGRGSKWGNPLKPVNGDVLGCVKSFRRALTERPNLYRHMVLKITNGMNGRGVAFFAEMKEQLPELRGKNLACWCPLDQPCHADVLLELANKP